MPEEFVNINVKECLHRSLRSLLDEVMQTSESHYKKNYLAKVNQWYNKKIEIIDEKLRKKPLPPDESRHPLSKKAFRRDQTIRKQREDIEKDDSPVKKIKLGRSPLSKTKFPPINKFEASFDDGGESPYKKYYEDASLSRKKTDKLENESFTGKLISLKQTPFGDYPGAYKENLAQINRRGLELWMKHREKKIILNRSEEQLQRSITKWGHHKSAHHERALM